MARKIRQTSSSKRGRREAKGEEKERQWRDVINGELGEVGHHGVAVHAGGQLAEQLIPSLVVCHHA
jgi:hypothetical protein